MIEDLKLKTALSKLIDYNWKDERRDFEFIYDVKVADGDTISEWIEFCSIEGVNHIFKDLLVLRFHIQEEDKI